MSLRTRSPSVLSGAAFLGLTFLATIAATAQGQGRNEPPTGQEIAEKAKSGALNRANAFTHTRGSKHFTFTPADYTLLKDKKGRAEEGVFGGTLTIPTVSANGLPPGQYNLFLAKVRGDWFVYAESNGQIAKAEKVTGRPKDLLESASNPSSAGSDKPHGPSAPGVGSSYADPGASLRSFELVFPMEGAIPYTLCFYSCWWYFGAVQCGDECEARYPLR